MTPSPECIALLRAVAAAPDDDVPRLVFADWLEEHGTTDADAARVEFIRLSCKMTAKQRLSPAEGKWLDANVRRLLPTVVAKINRGRRPPPPTLFGDEDAEGLPHGFSRSGRNVRLSTSLDSDEDYGDGRIFLHIEYWRGFARRVEYGAIPPATSFKNIGRDLAADEPLVVHMPESQAFPGSWSLIESAIYVRPAVCSEPAVWERVEGHSRIEGEEKVFVCPGGEGSEWAVTGQTVVKASIARAMTAVAREGTGWPAEW